MRADWLLAQGNSPPLLRWQFPRASYRTHTSCTELFPWAWIVCIELFSMDSDQLLCNHASYMCFVNVSSGLLHLWLVPLWGQVAKVCKSQGAAPDGAKCLDVVASLRMDCIVSVSLHLSHCQYSICCPFPAANCIIRMQSLILPGWCDSLVQ